MAKIVKIYNLTRPEEYFSKKENKQKARWYDIGKMTIFDNGKIMLKINFIEGNIHAFEMKGYTNTDKETYQKKGE